MEENMGNDVSGAPAPSDDQGQADGSPPAVEQTTSGSDEQVRELRRKLTEQAEEIKSARGEVAQAKELIEYFVDNGDRPVRDLLTQLQTGQAPEAKDAKLDELLSAFDEQTQGHLAPLLHYVQETARNSAIAQIQPRLREVSQFATQSKTTQAIQSAGVDPNDAGFQTFQKELSNQDWFRIVQDSNPVVAAQTAAARYLEQQGQTAQMSGSQQQIATAQAASLEAGGSRGSPAQAPANSFDYDPKKHNIMDLHAALVAGKDAV